MGKVKDLGWTDEPRNWSRHSEPPQGEKGCYSELGEAAESMSSMVWSCGETGWPPFTRFHFIRRFWNHTLTCRRNERSWQWVTQPKPKHLSIRSCPYKHSPSTSCSDWHCLFWPLIHSDSGQEFRSHLGVIAICGMFLVVCIFAAGWLLSHLYQH